MFMTNRLEVPAGFREVVRGGPFFMAMAPVFCRSDGNSLVLGLHVRPQHVNSHGNAHGGMLTTLADGALYDNLMLSRGQAEQIVTTSMSIDFLSAARIDDWLEAHVHVHRRGRLLSVADCLLKVGERSVLRVSATFIQPPIPPALSVEQTRQ